MFRILEPIKINMDTEVFFNVNWEDYRCSCIQHQKTEQADLHPDNKMPDSLVLGNTTIHQKFFDKDEVNYEELSKQTNIEKIRSMKPTSLFAGATETIPAKGSR